MVHFTFSKTLPLILSIFPAFRLVHANTPISDSDMQSWINGVEVGGNPDGANRLAHEAIPLFHFSKGACYPGHPLDANGNVKDAAARYNWPKADGSTCADPGGDHAAANPYPIFFTVRKCSDIDIRVTYNLYWAKDGFKTALAGHGHDWEGVVLKWKKTDDGKSWIRDGVWISVHTGDTYRTWSGAESTAYNGPGSPSTGLKNAERVKVYVGWGKHALRYSKKTSGGKSLFDVLGDNEYRTDDYYYDPDYSTQASWDYLLYSNPGTHLGDSIANQAKNPRGKEGYDGQTYPAKSWAESCDKSV
ncbi:hypothetical protein DL96DRAFT_1536251 [Flagelloscypha sp. PMI_526]|nr:hypothetical protein DL96DRAFT_1536251 [Flagelloscypha sp. PMI_526]